MALPPEPDGDEVQRLKRCINDLVSVLAMPAIWSGGEPSRIARTLLDALSGMLRLDFVYLRLNDSSGTAPIELIRLAQSAGPTVPTPETAAMLGRLFDCDPRTWPASVGNPAGAGDITVLPLQLGVQGDIGLLVAGSRREDFPQQTERLVLGVAANQATIALQEARRLGEQKRLADDVDQRVAQRTAELAAVNEELKQEIAERLRAETALRDSERNSRLIVDSVPGLVSVLTPGGEVEFVNRQILEYFGRPLEKLKGWATSDAVHPEDLPRAVEAFTRSIASGHPFEFEIRARRFDGVYRWFQSRGFPLRDANGHVVRWYNLLIDIHESKRAEEALRQSEAQRAEAERDLQLTIDTIPTLVTAYRPDGSRIFVNRIWLDYSGLSLDQALEEKRWSMVHPDDAERATEEWRIARATEREFKSELRLRRADGEYRWHVLHRVPARGKAGEVVKWYGAAVDIEDQKRAEQARQQSEARLAAVERELRLMIDTIPTLVASYWPNGERDFVNLAWQRFTGISQEQARGSRQMIAVHPDQDLGAGMWQRCLETGEVFELEERLRRVDGAYRWHWVRRVPARDENGNVIKWYGVGHDIDDQKQVESALRRSETRLVEAERELRLTLESIPTITWRGGRNGFVQQLNKRWFEYTGTTAEQIRGRRWQSCVHPDDLERLLDVGRAYVASGTPIDGEARLRRFDGTYRWFLFRPAPARDETGNIVGWYGIITDIEDRKRADEALRRSEAFLSRGQELSLTGSFSWHSATGEFTWSEQLYRIYEFQPGARITFELIKTRYHPEDKHVIEGVAEQARAGALDFDYGHRLLMPDGSIKYVHLVAHGSPARDGNGLEYFGAVQDVTQRRLAEEARDRAQSELAHVARITSLGVLTASIAHEVNQPLASIITNSETSLRRLTRPDPDIERVREIARRVVADARRAAEIIDRIRAMATRQPPKQMMLSLDEIIEESIVFLRHEFQSRGVSVTVDLAPELPQVVGDRTQLQQVIVNLTINAAQAMAESAAVKRSILIRTMSDTETVSCSIEDSGPGIDPTYLPRVFDSFFTTKDSGMGMGLPICRSIIESHEGQIRVDNNSTLGGARFSFALPANGHRPS